MRFEVLNGRLVVPLPQEELRPGKLGGGGRCPRSTHAHDFIEQQSRGRLALEAESFARSAGEEQDFPRPCRRRAGWQPVATW